MKRYLLVMVLLGMSVGSFAQSVKATRADGTECATLPCVVATVSLTDQGQPIPSTPIFTPTADGAFRMSLYTSTSGGTNKRAYWATFFGWTDVHGAKQMPLANTYPNGSSSISMLVQAVAGQPLLYQVKPVGGGGGVVGMTYDLLITIEQLQ